MDAEQLHFPDFELPDFSQPALERADLAQSNFTLPDPTRPDPAIVQLELWPADLDVSAVNKADPSSPDLNEFDQPTTLTLPASNAHMLPEPRFELGVAMAQRPGELDAAALAELEDSPDREEMPGGLNYAELYTIQDEMSHRKRHQGLLEMGLEGEL